MTIVNVELVVGEVIDNLLIVVAVAAPKIGVTKVGVFANTNEPVPVSSVIFSANSDDEVSANAFNLFSVYATVPPDPKVNVALSVPVKATELLTVSVLLLIIVNVAVETGCVIVTLLIVVAVAAPKIGVTKVGVFDNTTLSVPVAVVTPVPPDVTGSALVNARFVIVTLYDPLNVKFPPNFQV